MGKLATIKNRIYSDYLMPSRFDEYEEIIKKLKENGYKHITFKDYKILFDDNKLDGKYFINRHDIDTDVSTAKKFFEIEKKYGVKATYYFRLSTLDFDFMKEIHEYGSEASYHFEEIATFAKENHIKTTQEILERLDEIKEIFKQNFKMIENKLEFKLQTVCSHGDFVNRALKIVNNEITKDTSLRKELEILCETYDKDLMNSFNIYVSDRPYPVFYSPDNIINYIGKENIICMLSHPRQWRSNIIVNSIDNFKRIYEGLKW
jgi:hypothetical protein